MRKAQLMLSGLLFLLLVSCAPETTPAPGPVAITAPARSPATPAPAPAVKAAWEGQWQEIVEDAQKEGGLVLYTTLGGTQRRVLVSPFERRYGMRVEAVTSGSNELIEKLGVQRRAGLYQVDVFISGTANVVDLKSKNAVDPVGPILVLPELTQPELIKKDWYFGELRWVDKNHNMLASLIQVKQAISSNTNLVKPGEIGSYQDLLNPKWKGKMSLLDPVVGGSSNLWFAAVLEGKDVDGNYMRELAKQDLTMTRDRRLQVEWLAHGKHYIAISPYDAAIAEFIQIGAPVNRFSIGTPFVSASTSGISLMNKAPHPDAAKLFINWLLTKEGQTAHSQAVGTQSQRLDVPTSHLEPSMVLLPGLNVLDTFTEEFAVKQRGSYTELAKQIFGSLPR